MGVHRRIGSMKLGREPKYSEERWNQGSIPVRKPEKRLSHLRKAAGT